jgi:hypothetical protein
MGPVGLRADHPVQLAPRGCAGAQVKQGLRQWQAAGIGPRTSPARVVLVVVFLHAGDFAERLAPGGAVGLGFQECLHYVLSSAS